MKSEVPRYARTVRSEWAEWDLASESWRPPARTTVEEFRRDGQIIVSETRWGEESVTRQVNSHDDAGLLTESQFDGADGRQIYVYDDLGRLIRRAYRAPDGSEHVIEEDAYAADGSRTRVMYLPKVEGVTDAYCAVDGVDYYLSAPAATTLTTASDGHGLATEVLLKDAEGGILRRLVLTRDDCGRLVRDELLFGGLPLIPDVPLFGAGAALMTSEYKYDEQGRRVEVVRRMSSLTEARETIRYDDRDNRKETTTETQRREANAHEGTIEYGAVDRWEARFAYKYDGQGNWVERVISHRHGENPDFTPSSIERREIVYYDDSTSSH